MDALINPPQVIKAGDRYADMIEVWRDGVNATTDLWTEVDAINGFGVRYAQDSQAEYIKHVDGHYVTERVEGEFEIKWASE